MLYVFVVVYSLSCVQLFCDPMGYSPPGSSFHGISQARNWSELSSPPGDLTDSQGFATCASSTGRQILYEGSLMCIFQFSSVQSVMSDSLRPHRLQHARFPCRSPSPRVSSNSCPLSWWCHPTISSCHPLLLPPFNLSQHQGLFQWVSSLYHVAKVLEL